MTSYPENEWMNERTEDYVKFQCKPQGCVVKTFEGLLRNAQGSTRASTESSKRMFTAESNTIQLKQAGSFSFTTQQPSLTLSTNFITSLPPLSCLREQIAIIHSLECFLRNLPWEVGPDGASLFKWEPVHSNCFQGDCVDREHIYALIQEHLVASLECWLLKVHNLLVNMALMNVV